MKLRGLVQRILDSVPVELVLTDETGMCRLAKRRFTELTGLTREQALQEGWLSTVHAERRAKNRNDWLAAIAARSSHSADIKIDVPAKSAPWLSGRGMPLQSRLLGKWYVAAFWDITELRKAHDEVLRSKRFLDSIVDQIPAMVFVKDADTLKFVRFNRVAEEITGFRERDLLKKSDRDFFPPEQAEAFVAKDRQVLESDTLTVIEEEPIQTAHRGLRHLRTQKLALHDEDGRPAYLLGISEDITDLKRLRQAQQEADNLFKLMTDAASLLVWRTNTEKECIYLNRNWLEFTGRSHDEQAGWGWVNGVHPEDRERVAKAFDDAVENRAEYFSEYRLMSATGEYRSGWRRVARPCTAQTDTTSDTLVSVTT